MTKVVLDASAVIALLRREPGAELVEKAIGDAEISAVNYAEIVSYYSHARKPESEIDAMLGNLPFVVVPVDERLGRLAGHLRAVTSGSGLSLGDRFCLALAKQQKLSVLTADREWQTIAEAVGVKIIIIR